MSTTTPHHTCPVCGYAGLDEPPADLMGEPTYAICPSCGTQFGADDLARTHAELRADWISAGASWWSETKAMPEGWTASAQLAAAGMSESLPEAPPDGSSGG